MRNLKSVITIPSQRHLFHRLSRLTPENAYRWLLVPAKLIQVQSYRSQLGPLKNLVISRIIFFGERLKCLANPYWNRNFQVMDGQFSFELIWCYKLPNTNKLNFSFSFRFLEFHISKIPFIALLDFVYSSLVLAVRKLIQVVLFLSILSCVPFISFVLWKQYMLISRRSFFFFTDFH